MKFSTLCCLLLAAALMASGQSAEANRVLNLRGLHFLAAHASGSRLFLSVTGQPPEWEALVKAQPTPLKRRDPPELRRKVEVHFGRDVIGFALVSGVVREAIPTSTATNAPKMKLTSVSLIFDTPEQAGRAADLLRLPEVTPRPLNQPRGEMRNTPPSHVLETTAP
jgi:hypothetical protein